jgi:hypothetical protein
MVHQIEGGNMLHEREQHAKMDAEDAQRLSEEIDTAQGPGPVLDQDKPDPMPLFQENERAGGYPQGAVDPAEFAALGERTGDELDRIEPVGGADDLGVAGRAARQRPDFPDPRDE